MTKPFCRLYLVSPAVTDPRAFAPVLKAACAAGDVAAVLLRLVTDDERAAVNIVKDLAPIVQDAGAALIVAGPAAVAVRGGADGAHLDIRSMEEPAGVLEDAASQLRPQRILGVGGLKSRHIAMQAGEADVDYVMFGEPRPDGSIPPASETLERAGWWAAIFSIPCVAFAPTLDDVGPLAAAGVEFVALGDAAWTHPAGPAEAISEALASIAANVPAEP
ncbi:thiamine phosphate synthase [Chelatococcus asaccharovorans]|uniref:thiamine phosphate synthase n=1 Tax=Chelatococcus asaccharovorans TaxID=28210 RepID=UPI00224C7083|nr:thiamine phosphate synthase [Chelatococcus asaccharovorans]CAH1654402.1 Thiamin-phosphate pyrophosphorylase [Chelatococcus asaccharovorans]CAH1685757.1 Thiamin-phosphate pyrophosphorylase [Chelatococcus asaccharovorans]